MVLKLYLSGSGHTVTENKAEHITDQRGVKIYLQLCPLASTNCFEDEEKICRFLPLCDRRSSNDATGHGRDTS